MENALYSIVGDSHSNDGMYYVDCKTIDYIMIYNMCNFI